MVGFHLRFVGSKELPKSLSDFDVEQSFKQAKRLAALRLPPLPFNSSNPGRHLCQPNPAAKPDSVEQRLAAFRQTLHAIRRRLDLLVNLPAAKLEAMAIQQTAKDLAKA